MTVLVQLVVFVLAFVVAAALMLFGLSGRAVTHSMYEAGICPAHSRYRRACHGLDGGGRPGDGLRRGSSSSRSSSAT